MDATIKRVRDAILAMGMQHPQFLLLWDRVKHRAQATDKVPTMAVDAAGTIYVNPKFAESLTAAEIGGVICHELMHLVYRHADRRGDRDHRLFNVAGDMVINDALRRDGITLPASALYPPPEYTGTLQTEPLFDFLLANPRKAPPPPKGGKDGEPGDPAPGEGCGPIPAPEGEGDAQMGGESTDEAGEGGASAPVLRDGESWDDLRETVAAICDQIGKGNSAVRALLRPAPARTNWKRILRHGVTVAMAQQSRDVPTFARAGRRESPGLIRPGWTGTAPKIAIVIDVSGSMDRKWVDEIAAECKSISRTFPGIRMRLTTHTAEVCWDGWVTDMGKGDTLADAVSFTGGTDAAPAYEAVARAGKFDAMVHFTDGELEWPSCPAKRLIVGAFGAAADGRPWKPFPHGAHVIPCQSGR